MIKIVGINFPIIFAYLFVSFKDKMFLCGGIEKRKNYMYDNLVTTNTYAKMKGVTTECVRQWALQNKIKSVKIDGIRFIELSEEEMKERNKL